MQIKIMGPGCASCEKAAKIVQDVVLALGVDASIVKVTDFAEMAQAGVLSTPAVVIDGVIKCVGKVPSRDEIEGWLR